MIEKYKPTEPYDLPINPKRCRVRVPEPGTNKHFTQCKRNAVIGSWCARHHEAIVREAVGMEDEDAEV